MARAVLVLLLGVSLFGSAAAADACAERLLRVWPEPGSELSRNGRIVIEGYGEVRTAVAELAKRGPKLAAAGDEVDLAVVTSYVASRRVATVVLAPRTELKPGLSYQLTFGHHAKKESKDVFTNQLNALAWKASINAPSAPSWIAPPWLIALEAAAGDAKDQRLARISVDVVATGPWQLLAEVEGDGPPQRYLVEVLRSEARVGGEPCAAVFALKPGKRYQVTLSAIDSAGNVVPARGKPIAVPVS